MHRLVHSLRALDSERAQDWSFKDYLEMGPIVFNRG